MQRLLLTAGALAAALLLCPGCGDDLGSVRRITPQELNAGMEAGTAVAVDVRSVDVYIYGHIAKALSLPLGEVAEFSYQLPREKLIVTYCS